MPGEELAVERRHVLRPVGARPLDHGPGGQVRHHRPYPGLVAVEPQRVDEDLARQQLHQHVGHHHARHLLRRAQDRGADHRRQRAVEQL